MLLALVSVDLHHNLNHQTVINALQRVKHIDTAEREVQKVYVINKGEGQLVEFIGDDNDVGMEMVSDGKHKIIRKHFIHKDGGEAILKGHISVIASLIERGKVSLVRTILTRYRPH